MATGTHSASVRVSQERLNSLVQEVLPRQGHWDQNAYLGLTDHTRRLVELTDGNSEVLPIPTDEPQSILARLCQVLFAFLRASGGKVLFALLRLGIRQGKFREPDLRLVRDAGDTRRQNRFWPGADLVVEIVSPGRPERDLADKRNDYAEARIPEYWFVDPRAETVTGLQLASSAYVEHGVFTRGTRANSAVLDGV